MPCTVPSSPRRPCSALNTHSKPPSRKTSHVPASRSTGVTSWPRSRSAFATCSPERSDTSRSADVPPRRTASLTTSFPSAYQLDLRFEPHRCLHDKRASQLAFAQRRSAVPEMEVCRLPRLCAAARNEALDLHEDLADLPAPAARVLVDGAAYGARHTDRELEAAQVGVGDDAGEPHHLQPRAGTHSSAVDPMLAIHHPNDQAIDATIRDQEVRPRAEQQVRDVTFRAAFNRLLDRFGPRRLDEELAPAADPQRRPRRPRL